MNAFTDKRQIIDECVRDLVAHCTSPDRAQDVRDDRQHRVLSWAEGVFGKAVARDMHERALRVFEEAAELAQCEGIEADLLHDIVAHVFHKPKGIPPQEAGGVAVTLLAYCEARGLSADRCERNEMARAMARPRKELRQRQEIKAIAGIARQPE